MSAHDDHEGALGRLVLDLMERYPAWQPAIDTRLIFRAMHEQTFALTRRLDAQHNVLKELAELFAKLLPLTHLPQRIERMAQELDDLKAAVAANTDATAGNAALIVQQRGTIDTQAQQIKDLQAIIDAGAGNGGGGGTTGVDPAELVPLTKQITDNNNALVDATIPPAAPSPAPAG